jgi:AmiR/NasT family two-component response regulator
VIDQALGVVMGQNRCTADEAFDILRTISQNRNGKLRDVAAEIHRGQRTTPGTEARFT